MAVPQLDEVDQEDRDMVNAVSFNQGRHRKEEQKT